MDPATPDSDQCYPTIPWAEILCPLYPRSHQSTPRKQSQPPFFITVWRLTSRPFYSVCSLSCKHSEPAPVFAAPTGQKRSFARCAASWSREHGQILVNLRGEASKASGLVRAPGMTMPTCKEERRWQHWKFIRSVTRAGGGLSNSRPLTAKPGTRMQHPVDSPMNFDAIPGAVAANLARSRNAR